MGALSNSVLDISSDGRRYHRHQISAPGKLIAIAPGLSGLTTRSCHLIDISLGGCGLMCTTTIGLPDHYYLTIADFEDRIGCAEVYRNGSRIGIKFIRELDPAWLRMLLASDRIRLMS